MLFLPALPATGTPPVGDAIEASWVTARDIPNGQPNVWTVFRRAFVLPKVPVTAEARVAADTKYWLYVNGRLAVFEGGLKRGPNPHDTYYDVLDLAPCLQPGDNSVEAVVWHFGKDGFSHKNSGRSGFLFELRDSEVSKPLLATDASWEAAIHHSWTSAGGEPVNFRLPESSLRYDGRKSFHEKSFSPAVVVGQAGAPPWGLLHRRPIPLWRDSGLRDYASIDGPALPRVSNGETFVARLPYNTQVTPCLDIEAPAGAAIDIRSDHDEVSGQVCIRAEYITRNGRQNHESLGWMNGHEISYTIPKGITVHALRYRETSYATDFTGSFECDDPFLNRLWEKSRRTLLVTMRDTFMDCPDRERAQWWGDAVIQIGQSFYAFSPSATQLARKAVNELCHWQREDGTLYSPVPAGNWDKELSQQMLASIGRYGFWNYYLNSGDRETAIAAYPHVRAYLELWKLDANGLVEHRAGGWDWADWGERIDTRLLDQGWYCLALEGAANLAELAGRPDEAEACRARRRDVIAATNRHLWDPAANAYRSPGYQGETDDRGQGLAVVAGIAGPEQFPAIRRILATARHSSPYLEKYVLESLLVMGDTEAFFTRLKDRYGPLVANDSTTLPELWLASADDRTSGTMNHSWTGGPLTLLSQYVAGLSPIAPGWTRYQIRPQPGPFRRIAASVDSAAGRIRMELHRSDESVSLELESPPGSIAELQLPIPIPGKAPASIRVNGEPISKDSPVTLVSTIADRVHLRAQPGRYRIEIHSRRH